MEIYHVQVETRRIIKYSDFDNTLHTKRDYIFFRRHLEHPIDYILNYIKKDIEFDVDEVCIKIYRKEDSQ